MSIQNRLDRIVALSAVAATGATVGFTQNAEAAIVSSGIVNLNVPSTTSGIYLNVVTGVFATTPGGASGWDLNPWSSSGLSIWANNAASPQDGVVSGGGSSATLVDNLALGTLVDGSSVYARTGGVETTGSTAFALNSSGNYIGFRFTNEANGNSIHFGWARFSIAGTLAGQPRTLVEYAYEDQAGVGINVGAVPTPGTAALLALGAVGMAGRRRK
jgi:hypothetical protein